MKKIIYSLGLILSLILIGCSKEIPLGEYDTKEIGRLKKVASGMVISKRPVRFHSKASANNASKAPGSEYLDGGQGYVYVVKLNSGEIISVAQAEDLKLDVKQRVLIIYGKNTRLMPDNSSGN